MISIRGFCQSLALAGLSVLVPSLAWSTPPKDSGVICIAPFRMDEEIRSRHNPLMSTTPAPSPETVFTFTVDKRLKAKVASGEMARITGVPVDRRVKVEIRMDKEGFETFWLHLGKEPDQRVCLWLYPGYWHWIDNGWNPKLGCKCEVDG